MSPSSLTTPLLVSVWPTSLLVPTLSIPLLVPMLSMTDVRKKAAISATNSDLVRGPAPGREVAQFQGALLPAGDNGFAADKARNTAAVQSLYEPAGESGQGDHRQLDCRAGAEDGRRLRSEREEISFDRDGNARSVRATQIGLQLLVRFYSAEKCL